MMKVAYIFPPPWDPTYPPYSMALLGGSARHHGHDFHGFDLNVDLFHAVTEEDKQLWDGQYSFRWSQECDRVIQQYHGYLDAYVAGILQRNIPLCALYMSLCSKQITLFIARKIKEKDPGCGVILGGPQCFPAYEGLAVLENSGVDAICMGEGDSAWPLVLDHFSRRGDLRVDAPGIAYRTVDGTLVDGGAPDPVNDLGAIPFPDYRSFDFPRYGAMEGAYYQITSMTSRGCINTCAFCSDRPSSYRYRYRNAENIVKEIETHISVLRDRGSDRKNGDPVPARGRHVSLASKLRSRIQGAYTWLRRCGEAVAPPAPGRGQDDDRTAAQITGPPVHSNANSAGGSTPSVYVSFNDSLVNGTPKELEKFCDLIVAKGIQFKWGGMALFRKEMTKELLDKMKAAGCWNLSWGLESGCQEVLGLMQKRYFTMDLAKGIIKEAHSAGIHQCISLIVGFPGETEEMFQETIRFLADYKSYFDRIGTQTMKIYRNSVVHDKYQEFGLDYENAQEFAKWRTLDGTNDYETRVKRLNILRSILNHQILTIDG
jgi:radical SAM superfamily enzyme YgiQ (UPF0313 family)